MTDYNDLIILNLQKGYSAESHTVFIGQREWYSHDFELRMPTHEWKALGRPEEIQFLVSTKTLSVGRDGVMIQ